MNHTKSARIAGLIAAVAAVGLALTPSLVPRPALFQGFLAGLSFGLAYLAASWLWRTVAAFIARRRQSSPGARPPAAVSAVASASDTAASAMSTPTGTVAAASGRSAPPLWVWPAAGALAGIYVAVVGILAVHWQNDVRAKVEMAPVDGLELGTFFVVALLVGAMVFGVHRGLRTMAALGRHWTQRLLQKSSSSESLRASLRPASRLRIVTAGGLLTGTLTVVLALTLLVSGALLGTDRVYSARNDTTPAGITEPASEFRSAGSQSAVEWEKLGMQGRAFVGGGPTAATIEALTRAPAKEPVRVYVGSVQAASMADRAKVAVAELKRTGAFSRGTLMIANPTGSGWLERQAVDSLEYLHGGDTAIVSMQYSYQPSWVSFLFHQDLPRASAQALYKAVKAEWDSMPEAKRPELLVYGLSLGASGMQSAFGTVEELTSTIDGAVFSGAPNNSQPWGELQAQRDPGSPVWQPVFDGGRNVRWLSNNGDFDKLTRAWEPARVAYLQHGTDAVTWLTPALIWQKPDWLAGSSANGGRAPDVSDSMRWIPLITYLQVAFDMFMGEAVPASHGHNFGDVAVQAWNGVSPSGLDQPALDRIQAVIAAYPYEESMTN
ncbi:hypothetical protein AS189_11345 [Arthrobacter alpinus]|uniref:Alpha/beta-hydrolase family protein n=1 Tax=Arthrobacter alpinus TaxID=656366 RepID=A0A0S2LZV1_9MICC|nr:alpha/beta-hydrolase family protein [Arthrobacter alpinus]ALO66978.1 hypothetical protein AS189_11345 [Arthrobacter alpinus]